MLKRHIDLRIEDYVAAVSGEDFFSHEIVGGDLSSGLILLCDHARNGLPSKYDDLGLPQTEFQRHIAFDIGVEGVTRKLAARLGVPALMTHFSRLLIDPNRGLDDPTLVMRVSDGAVVPGNALIGESEKQSRIERYYAPYHRTIDEVIDRAQASGIVPALLSIHSFTAHWKGVPRPWDAGVLWDGDDRRFSDPLISGLRGEPQLVVGDNEPYSGGLPGDTMDMHGTRRGLAHALLEIRQDLIADTPGIDEWSERLAGLLPGIMTNPALHSEPVIMRNRDE